MSKKNVAQPAVAAPYQPPSTEDLLLLEVEDVLADENSRFELKPLRIESLANDIKEKGEVTTPIEVEPIEGATAMPHFRLTAGFYRHAAAAWLNANENAGVMLPARLKALGDPVTRLRRQLAENMERENQSPMDKAVAIKKLMDAGVEKAEIRRIFSTPGGRKGLKLQAASNSFVNIMLNLLELPKTIQADIHNGIIGVAAAYELGKVPADKRSAVVERAKADYDKQAEVEARDEEKLLKQESRLAEVQDEAVKAGSEMEQAEAAVTQSIANHGEKLEQLRKLQRDPLGDGRGYLELKPEEKAKFTETLKAAEQDVKSAEKIIKDTAKKVDVLKGKVATATKTAEQVRKKLEDARKPKKKSTKVGSKQIRDAAAKEGVAGQPVKLNAKEMRDVVEAWAGGQVAIPKVSQLGAIILECFDGITTPKQMIGKVYEFLGLKAPTR